MTYRPLGQIPTCLTQAQHDEAVKVCSYQTVRGVGALPSGDPCKLKLLPICAPPVRANIPAMVMTTTVPDQAPSLPTCAEDETFDTESGSCKKKEDEPNYMLWGGLALLLVAAGGYVAYKATRKP